MKIALAQLNYTTGDVEGNTLKIIDAIDRAKEEGAKLVLFAEQSISGMPAYDLLHKNTFLELCEDALVQIASYCDGIAVIIGMPLLTDNGTISAAALIQDLKVLRYVGKQNITARREMGYLSPSSGYEYATIGGLSFAIVVGDDLSRLQNIDSSVGSIISINARKYGRGILNTRHQMLQHKAFVEDKNIIFINQVGGSADLIYDGSSCIFNKRGEMTHILKSFEEDFGVFNINEDVKGETRPPFESYSDRAQIQYRASKLGLKDFFEKSGYEKACIGLSGGIDSSVVASIAVAALGSENVVGLIMPSEFSLRNSTDEAVALAENLGIEYHIIPISESYKSILEKIAPFTAGTQIDATEENIISRLRTIILMALQNKKGHVLLNSSNKSENALGLCTIYGDTAGAISITGDLYKGEIYDIAKYINKTEGNLIPESILSREPSSELRPDRRDAHQLPPYEIVDAIVYRMIEKNEHREEIANAGYDIKDVELIHKMIMQSEKKRYQYPPVLRLSNYTFGHERVMPLTHKYGD